MDSCVGHIQIGDKVVVTTDSWFYGHDGRLYRGVYGTVHGIETDQRTLGIKTNSRSTNWYLRVGNMTIAGCQIHYVAKVIDCPPRLVVEEVVNDQGDLKRNTKRIDIYIADELIL